MDAFSAVLKDIEDTEPWLLDHMERVGMFAYALGKEFDVDKGDCGRLYDAGFLHGLGEHYLHIYQHKANASDETVAVVQKAWPMVAGAMISMVPGFEYIAKLVAQCGENFDGSGDPFGAVKHDIHVYAMMVHIADLYDTVRMSGASHDSAATELRRLSGIAIPKKMITPFLKNIVSNEDLRFDYADVRRQIGVYGQVQNDEPVESEASE